MNKSKYRDVYVCNNPGFYFYNTKYHNQYNSTVTVPYNLKATTPIQTYLYINIPQRARFKKG